MPGGFHFRPCYVGLQPLRPGEHLGLVAVMQAPVRRHFHRPKGAHRGVIHVADDEKTARRQRMIAPPRPAPPRAGCSCNPGDRRSRSGHPAGASRSRSLPARRISVKDILRHCNCALAAPADQMRVNPFAGLLQRPFSPGRPAGNPPRCRVRAWRRDKARPRGRARIPGSGCARAGTGGRLPSRRSFFNGLQCA